MMHASNIITRSFEQVKIFHQLEIKVLPLSIVVHGHLLIVNPTGGQLQIEAIMHIYNKILGSNEYLIIWR